MNQTATTHNPHGWAAKLLVEPSIASTDHIVQTYRLAMRQLAGGVSVITAASDQERTGLTATSVVSLSLDPPELLISVNQNSSSWPVLLKSRCFGVNVLSQSQRSVAERFSGKNGIKGDQRYLGEVWHHSDDGVWLLKDALASFSCQVENILIHRSHAVIIGAVTHANITDTADNPLIYWQGQYRGPGSAQ